MASFGPAFRQAVANAVQERITQSGMTVLQLSNDTGIPRTTLQRRLAAAQSFTVDELASIATKLDCEVADLLAPVPVAS